MRLILKLAKLLKWKIRMNKVILIGNLTRDVELTTTSSGVNVAKFTLAVQRRFKSANGESETDFINIVAWRELAENCAKYLSKGNKAAVVGSVQIRSYDANDGNKRYITEVNAEEVEFLTPKKTDEPGSYSATSSPPPKQAKKTTSELKQLGDDEGLPF